MYAVYKKYSTSVSITMWAGLCACLIFSGYAQAGDNGVPVPIPRFTTIPSGGTAPVTVNFDPLTSYLPVSVVPNQIYLYQARWNFGDGTPDVYVPPAPSSDQNLVLAPQSHIYTGEGLFVVRLTLTIFIGADYIGPNAFTEMLVLVANINYPPVAAIQNTGSVTMGIAPFMLTVTPSFAQDQDGYIVWVAIDWGDGSAQLIPNPPSLPTTPILHQYAIPGIYKVTMSVIDNGRIPFGTIIPNTPAPNDPQAALAYYIGFQQILALAAQFNPILQQDFIMVQVFGSMTALKGQFKLDFVKTNSDALTLELKSNLPVDNVVGATISITLGSGANALKLPDFKTNNRGQFKNHTGFRFSFNRKNQHIQLKVSKTLLTGALNIANATMANGNTDVPVTITIGSNTLSTTVRFAYQSEAGGKAIGKIGHSVHTGN
ncbi:MAG: hypothetical protein V1899_12750 [Planctomycetota bacterium]